jgi:hypothetical protein
MIRALGSRLTKFSFFSKVPVELSFFFAFDFSSDLLTVTARRTEDPLTLTHWTRVVPIM